MSMGGTTLKREFYQSLHNTVIQREWLRKLVVWGVKLLPGIVYLAYPLMVLYFLAAQRQWLFRGILVPAAGFVLVTGLRSAINAPRPYEALGIPSVTPKDTKGKSFPSRHAACGAVIAGTALLTVPVIGWLLLVISLLIAVSRVLAGVHFVRDVAAGWLLGMAVALVGFLI